MAADQSAGPLGGAQPGQVIAPGGVPPATGPAENTQAPAPTPQPAPEPPAAPAPAPPEPPAPIPFADESAQPPASAQPTQEVTWTASEFIAHDKAASWYLGLAAVAAIIAGFVYLITRDYISASVVLVGALALGVLAGRKPRQLQYRLDVHGLTVGTKHYNLGSFRSFSVVPEGAFSSIVFMPLKRFAPLLTVYYAPEDEEKIVSVLADRLPFEEHKADAVDNLMKRIRF